MKKKATLSAIALMVLLSTSCGGGSALKSFRLAIASSGPLVNSLVLSGAIDQPKANAIVADFDAGAQCGVLLQRDIAAIPPEVSNTEKNQRKLDASVMALGCFRMILNRGNFAAHPKVQNAANIAEGILNSLVIFYSESGEPTKIQDEKELEKRIEKQMDALNKAMKP